MGQRSSWIIFMRSVCPEEVWKSVTSSYASVVLISLYNTGFTDTITKGIITNVSGDVFINIVTADWLKSSMWLTVLPKQHVVHFKILCQVKINLKSLNKRNLQTCSNKTLMRTGTSSDVMDGRVGAS